MLRQITHEPNVTHHSWIPWQWLIYLSCPWHMPQLESNFLQTSLFSFLLYFSCCGSAAALPYIRRIIAASRGSLITKHSFQVSERLQERNLGQGLYIASWWHAILLNGNQCGMTFFRNWENDHQSCGPEQRGFIIVCSFHSVTLGIMRNQMELERKLRKPGMNA